MADKKVSQLTSLATTAAEDLLLVIDDPNGTPTSKNMTVKSFFGAVPSNTVFNGRVTLKANATITCSNTVVTSNVNITSNGLLKVNNFITTIRSTPASNNAATTGYKLGQAFFTNTHLYIAVNATTLKRIALSTF